MSRSIADFVDVANFAAAMKRESGESGFEKRGSSRHRKLIAEIPRAEWLNAEGGY